MIHLSAPLLIAAVFVFIGALVQGSVGFGVGMVAAPFLMWAVPDTMPATLVILGGAMTLLTLTSHWRDVDVRALAWAITGRVPGLALGAWLVVTVPTSTLGVVVGIAVIIAAILQWKRWTIPNTAPNLVVAGLVSGTTGTATGIGGPPVAMVLADQPGAIVRGTLAAYFMLGSALSLTALGMVGHLTPTHAGQAAVLLIPLVLGGLLAGRMTPYLDDGRTRRAILLLAGLSRLMLALTSLI